MYGGLGVAVAMVLIIAGIDFGVVRTGVPTAVSAALLGMAGGRLASRLTEPPRSFYPSWFYFWLEIIGGGLLLLAAWA